MCCSILILNFLHHILLLDFVSARHRFIYTHRHNNIHICILKHITRRYLETELIKGINKEQFKSKLETVMILKVAQTWDFLEKDNEIGRTI